VAKCWKAIEAARNGAASAEQKRLADPRAAGLQARSDVRATGTCLEALQREVELFSARNNMSKPTSSAGSSELQGEGNREADREYREGATRHANSGKSEAEGRTAEQALETDSKELEQAEKIGKSKAKGPASR
jgi:hypothetical protein